jgi:hypothetical protein
VTAPRRPAPLTPAERAAIEPILDHCTPNQLRAARTQLGLTHAAIDDYEQRLADAQHATWPGE